jgi:hypothetical protein
VFDAADALWRDRYRVRFAPFLANTRRRDGEILLALALAGEGRTLMRDGEPATVVVGFPREVERASEVLLVFAHEVVGSVANDVIADVTSPADRRSGVADRYGTLAAVRGGALLLARVAPELVGEYHRFYLRLAGVRAADADLERRFAETFALPAEVHSALERQIDIILGGI